MILVLLLSIFSVLHCSASVYGDMNSDNVVDVEDVNAMINIILKIKTINDYPNCSDLNGDDIIDVSDVNRLINIILGNDEELKCWLPATPQDTINGAIISYLNRYYTTSVGRMLVYRVTESDTLRITIDHDNTINVNMKSWVIFDSDNPEEWMPEHVLSKGENIKNINGVFVQDNVVVPIGGKVLVCSAYFNENGKIGDDDTAVKMPFTAYKVERWGDVSELPIRKPLNVLAVGNSFTCDELSYMPYIIQSLDPTVDMTLRLLYRRSGNILDWSENVDADSVAGAPNYYYEWKAFPGRWSTRELSSLRQCVESNNWDVIVFQQESTSPYWDVVESPLTFLVNWLRNNMHFKGKVGWLLTHAYSDSNVCHSVLYPELKSSDDMWESNIILAQNVMSSGMVDLLLPTGTALQNARHSSLSSFTFNQFCAGQWSGNDTGDIHLQEGVGPFVSACAAAGVLIGCSPEGAHVNLSSTWMIPNANPNYNGKGVTLSYIDSYLGGLGMDDVSQQLASECAHWAIISPFELWYSDEPLE